MDRYEKGKECLESIQESSVEEIFKDLLHDEIANLLNTIKNVEGFSERDIEVIKMRYGLAEYNNQTLSHIKIAQKLGISKDKVRLIEMKVLRKIRYQIIIHPKLKGLRNYLK